MKSIRCRLGLHKGGMEPCHLLDEDIDGLSAFKCYRCGEVVE